MGIRISTIFLIFFLSSLIMSCSNSKVNKTGQKETKNNEVTQKTKAGPKVIIYKTKADYYYNVPVTLIEDKSAIASYPGIKDIYYKGELAYPTKLNNGYLLDNRGIDQHVAFLNYTYEQYSKFDQTPSSDELFTNVLDNDPIAEMYFCGSQFEYEDLITELNEAIDNNRLSSFQKLK